MDKRMPDYIKEGAEHLRGGRLRDAVEAFENAHKLDPGDDVAITALADAYARLGRELAGRSEFDNASVTLSKAVRLNPAPRVLNACANVRLNMGDRAGALEAYERSIRMAGPKEDLISALHDSGTILLASDKRDDAKRREDIERALGNFKRVEELGGEEERRIALEKRLVAETMLGKPREAKKTAEKLVGIDPRKVSYLMSLALAQKRLGDNAAALAGFDRAYELSPKSEGVIRVLVDHHAEAGFEAARKGQDSRPHHIRALELAKRGVMLAPWDPSPKLLNAYVNMALALGDRHFKRADKLLGRLAYENRKNPEPHYYRGVLASVRGNGGAAVRHVARFVIAGARAGDEKERLPAKTLLAGAFRMLKKKGADEAYGEMVAMAKEGHGPRRVIAHIKKTYL